MKFQDLVSYLSFLYISRETRLASSFLEIARLFSHENPKTQKKKKRKKRGLRTTQNPRLPRSSKIKEKITYPPQTSPLFPSLPLLSKKKEKEKNPRIPKFPHRRGTTAKLAISISRIDIASSIHPRKRQRPGFLRLPPNTREEPVLEFACPEKKA